MIVKKIFLNKYNKYLVLIFFMISIFGSVYIYNNKELHHHVYIYKVQLPNISGISREEGVIGAVYTPLMGFYEFRSFIENDQGISNNCPNFSKSVRVSIWEARNEIDWRIEIKYSNTKDILKCINQIVEAIEEKKINEIEAVKKLMELENSIFEDSVKRVIQDVGFLKFKSFIDEEFKGNKSELTKPDDLLKLLAAALKVELLPTVENANQKSFDFSQNFLRGYIYNFMDSYRSFRHIDKLSETKYEKVSGEYFLNKNILKFNFAILFLMVLSLIAINFKKIKKLI